MRPTFFFPTDRDVAVIKKLRMHYGKNANIQQGYIRLEKELSSTNVSENFTFGRGQQSGVKRELERFLADSDVFVALKMGVFLQKENAVAGNNGNAVNYSYPDLNVFADAAAAGEQSEADCLEAIYNGSISMKSNTFEVVDKMSLQPFRVVPQTQFYAGSTAAGDVIPAQQAGLGTIEGGFVDIHTVPVFEGKKRNELKFEVAQGADVARIGGDSTTIAAGKKNILVFHMLGYLVRNASESVTIEELAKQGTLM